MTYSIRSKSLLLALGVIMIVLFFTTATAAAPSQAVKVKSSSVQLVFDGKTLVLPEGQYIFAVNNSTYVPLRFVSYALQKSVKWDAKTATVTVSEPTKSEAVVLKEYLLNAAGNAGESSAKGGQTIQVSPIAAKYNFDGASKNLPKGQSSYILNGTIYVPVRFVSEAVGKTMTWDPAKGQITASIKASTEQTSGTGASDNKGTDTATTKPGTTTDKDKETGNSAGTGAAGSGGAGTVTKPTYEAITGTATSRLETLQSACQTDLTNIAFNYLGASSDADKATYKNQGLSKLNSCSSQFESIVKDTESQLIANGYDTGIIAEYRAAFNKQLETGKAIFEAMSN